MTGAVTNMRPHGVAHVQSVARSVCVYTFTKHCVLTLSRFNVEHLKKKHVWPQLVQVVCGVYIINM